MGFGYNENIYPRPITLAKRYLLFYRCHGPYTYDKTNKFFIFNNTLIYSNNIL